MNFIYIIRPNKDDFLNTATEEEENIMSEHAEYLNEKLKDGKLILAGPATNAKFGIVILNTETEAEAETIMLNDPAVKKNVMSAELNPFRISFFKK